MNAALRELSDQIDQATQRLLDTARIITEPDLRAPSLLPGWTRAHVLAHVARNADAMRNVLAGVRTGQDRPGYASAEAREAGIEQDAGRPARELTADLADSAMALRTVARQLPDDGWQVPVRVPGLASFPAAELLIRRLVEVELHHSDLGTGYGPAEDPVTALPVGGRQARPARLAHVPAVRRPGRPAPGRRRHGPPAVPGGLGGLMTLCRASSPAAAGQDATARAAGAG